MKCFVAKKQNKKKDLGFFNSLFCEIFSVFSPPIQQSVENYPTEGKILYVIENRRLLVRKLFTRNLQYNLLIIGEFLKISYALTIYKNVDI